MDEKKFEEILYKNNMQLVNLFNSRFDGIDKKFDHIDEKFAQIDEKFDHIDEKFAQIDEKFDHIDEKFDHIDEKFIQIDKRFDEMEQKRIDDNFYFEHKYGEKIAIIFDKIQLMDELRTIDNEESKKLEKRIDYNSERLMSHDFRISKLEQYIKSK